MSAHRSRSHRGYHPRRNSAIAALDFGEVAQGYAVILVAPGEVAAVLIENKNTFDFIAAEERDHRTFIPFGE